ncbi:MAG: PD40 domain-containing protein [Gammaproteobacteria bacterium]|nr:PD40 domain-containing protein [Gammaproteobacteria bacterium]
MSDIQSPSAVRRAVASVCAGLSMVWLAACGGGSGSSNDPAPSDPTAHIPINTAAGWSDSPFISRDGKRLYFMYSRYDFSVWLKSGGITLPPATGPERSGLHKNGNNPWDESDIYVATKNPDGTWGEAVNLGLNGAYADSSGMEINDGNTFIWLQGNGTHNDLLIANRNSDGGWSSAASLDPGINDPTPGVRQDNPHLSADGHGLWFLSNRAGGFGGTDIWFSFYTNGSWSAPVNAGAPFNTAGDDDQMWVSPVGPDIYWNSPSGLMHCLSNGSTCTASPTVISIAGCGYAAEASFTDDGQYMYFACGDLTTYKIKIMYSVKQANGSWGPAIPVD